jgi:hypothetical protein
VLRFDDTLETVLAADLGSPQAAQSAWRQLVDLIGRRRAPADARAMSVLRSIRAHVPVAVRVSSARALEFADPPAPLVRLFAMDELSIALPVLRHARMNSAEWIQLLPELAPAGRAVLRNRRDLGPIVKRALEAFGPIDFVLPDETAKEAAEALPEPVAESPPTEAVESTGMEAPAEALPEPEPEIAEASLAGHEPSTEAQPEASLETVDAPELPTAAEIEPLKDADAELPRIEPEPQITYWAGRRGSRGSTRGRRSRSNSGDRAPRREYRSRRFLVRGVGRNGRVAAGFGGARGWPERSCFRAGPKRDSRVNRFRRSDCAD